MKLPTVNGNVIDTDKMPDVSAELQERIAAFHEWCTAHNVLYLLRVYDPHSRTMGGACQAGTTIEEYGKLIHSLNHFFQSPYGGKGELRLVRWDLVKHLFEEQP